MTAWGIVVAAGRGSRFGGPKHEVELLGRPLWDWARRSLLEGGVSEVVVVGSVPGGVPGGERRRDSVAAGLAVIPEAVSAIVIHDAARPLAGSCLVSRVLERLAVGDVAGVVPGIPVRDTLKQVEGGRVVATIDRAPLISVQTPQAFLANALRKAHAADHGEASDDAMLLERVGELVAWVEGDPANLKVTYPDDLSVLEAMVR
ncbi:MAG: 2-C-methyl-D-erythritol 4-phosphate cytidylyltransferase [Acidimicrobiia bacterium]|nr:2-C-methyl-D-erythritol 4-phosphate cytidylyltransferase [Acidimicrobiia bacterium]